MSPVIKYIILGVIQGLTEFLPVSSSAHLLILREVFNLQEHRILLEIVLHLGTLLALVVFLLPDLQRLLNRRIIFLIFLATALTGLVVIVGQDFFERMFAQAKQAALPLVATGIILLLTKKFSGGRRGLADLRAGDAFWLGLVQGLAVIPGLSRSGVTISTLLFRQVEKEAAFKFSLLISILAICGALILKGKDFLQTSPVEFKYMLIGFGAAFFSGLAALKLLLAIIQRMKFHLFGYYCLILAIALWC